MRKKSILFGAALLLVGAGSFAQTGKGKITGTVQDGSQRTLESATITLLRAKDSSVVKINVADKTGHFVFEEVPSGRYLVSVSAVGHEKGYSETVELDAGHPSVELRRIDLVTATKTLDGVVVTAKKPLIEQKVDRTIVNVEASTTNVGTTALDVLEKSPGVTVDKDGNISLKGKSGVQIYIDGRPAYLSGQDLANMLRNMNSSQLEQIEIMTNPPAKYDAAGNSGIINIKTKKNKQFGYNGSLTLGYGQASYPKFNEGFNFNYRTGKFNLFTNLSHSFYQRYQDLNIQRRFRNESTKELTSDFIQTAHMTNKSQFYNGKVGLDYNASKKTTLGFVASGFSNNFSFLNRNVTDIYYQNGDAPSQTRAISENGSNWKNFSGNLNFRHSFDSTGREITADLDYIKYNAGNDQSLVNSYYNLAGSTTSPSDTLLGNLPQVIRIYSGKVDYSHPLKKGAKLEAGIKTSFVKTDNNAQYDSLINGQQVPDYGRSNYFIYQENINAAYATYSRPLSKKLSAQVGLRLENTHSKGRQVTTQQDFDRNYTQLFPTAYLQYNASDKNQFVLNYGRRIDRPDYEDLNPFMHFLDKYTYEKGNPDLRPQFSHNIELSHTYRGFLTTTLNYSRTTDIIQQVFEQHEATNETFITRDNIAWLRQYGISVSAYKQWTKWWSGNLYANLFNNHFEGQANGDPIALSSTTLVIQSQQQFKLKKGWGTEISGFYRTKGLEGVIVTYPLGQISLGASKQVLNNKGTVRLNVRDAFNLQHFKGYSRYGNIDISLQNYFESRVVNLSFTYRFSKGKLNAAGNRKKGGADEEQNRVKIGGN
ncbi:MAG TPA: TonB-dependent receptor [Chitinophagaceae bacterium]|nr:TonB-dependent receptor [Chitinophagaceae bacterium]